MSLNYTSICFSLLALSGGLVMLVSGGECLVAGAVRFARRLGMRSLLVGLTIVAFGTSLPELFVSIYANLNGHPDIMIGNVVGSNIANVGLVLGISAMFGVLSVHFSRISLELYLLALIGLVVMGITFFGSFYRIFGVLFVVGLILYTFMAYKRGRGDEDGDNAELPPGNNTFPYMIGLQIAGLVLMAYGSNLFIKGAVDVAITFGVSELVIGLTVAAVGTSLPELASSLSAIRRGEGEMLVGNIIGSNLFNLLMVMGGTAVVKPFMLSRDLLYRDMPVMWAFSLLILVILYFRHKLTRCHGLLLLAGYGAYLFWLT